MDLADAALIGPGAAFAHKPGQFLTVRMPSAHLRGIGVPRRRPPSRHGASEAPASGVARGIMTTSPAVQPPSTASSAPVT